MVATRLAKSLSVDLLFALAVSALPMRGLLAETSIPQRGGTVIFALGSDPTTLNRNLGSSFPEGMTACIFYQGLTRLDAHGEVKPELAKSWTESEDGRTYAFDLDKTQWEDGQPFTSDDVKYSILEISAKYSPTFAGAGRSIDFIETPSPDKVIVHLKQPYGPFLASLSCQSGGAILPKHVFEGTDVLKNPATTSRPIGLGPFLFKEWKRGDYIRFVRNPNYREKGKPYLDELIAKILPQGEGRVQALQAGEIDYLNNYYLPTNDYDVLKADPKIKMVDASGPPGGDQMTFNTNRRPLDDKRVRQALFMAMDRDYIIRTAYLGFGNAGSEPLSDNIAWTANPAVDYRKMYPYDPARANALLDEIGLRRGSDGLRFKINLLYLTDTPQNPLAAQIVKSEWGALGVGVDLIGLERTAALARIFQNRDFDVAIVPSSSGGDPALGLAPMFVSSMIGKLFGNSSGYSNPEIDQLFVKAETGRNQQERAKYYYEIQSILAVDLPNVPMRERHFFNAQSISLHGLENENLFPTWRDAWISK